MQGQEVVKSSVSPGSGEGNVLLVANHPPDVGFAWWLMERYWSIIANQIDAQGRDAHIVFPAPGPLPPQLVDSPLTVHVMDFGSALLRNPVRTVTWLWKHGIRSIYVTDWAYFDIRYALLRLGGAKSIVLHDHSPGYQPVPSGVKRALKKAIHRLRFLSASRYVGATPFVGERLMRSACVPPQRVGVVTNGLPVQDLDGDTAGQSSSHVRQGLSIDSKAIVVGLVSRAHPYKNLSFAIDVAEQLADRSGLPPIVFLHCGDGPELPMLQTEVGKRGLEERFIFAGRRSDISKVLSECDIGFHPSLGEVGFSLSTLEMMDASLPVVVPALESVAGATKNEQTGLLYEPNSIQGACDAIASLAKHDAYRRRLGKNAKQDLLTNYSIGKTDEALVADVVRYL